MFFYLFSFVFICFFFVRTYGAISYKKLTNLKTQKLMKPETKSKWDTIIKLAIAILSAIAGAIGASACSVII